MRPDFDEDVVTLLDEGGRCAIEEHRLADVEPPVVGIQLCAFTDRSGHGRDVGDLGGLGLDVRQRVDHTRLDAIHGRAVEGVIQRQALGKSAVGTQRSFQLAELVAIARQGNAFGAIDARQTDLVEFGLGEPRSDLIGTHRHRRHFP